MVLPLTRLRSLASLLPSAFVPITLFEAALTRMPSELPPFACAVPAAFVPTKLHWIQVVRAAAEDRDTRAEEVVVETADRQTAYRAAAAARAS